MARSILEYTDNNQIASIAQNIISEQTKSIENLQNSLCCCDNVKNCCKDVCEYTSRINGIMKRMFKDMSCARLDNNLDCNFLRTMIPHHRGAVEMARTAMCYCICEELCPILKSIIESQEKGICRMEELMDCLCCCRYITVIAGDAGHAEHTGFLVQNVQNLGYGQVLFVAQILNKSRIDISGTGSHDHTFERGKAHGGIYTFAVLYSGKGSTISHMAYDDLQIVVVFAKELCGSLGYEFMRSSVEAVFTDCVFLIVLFRNTVHICFRRHGLMECGIKYCYVRNARHQFHAGIDSHQVCRIVQRTKVSALLDNFDYFVIDDNRVCDLHSAVQNAVSDGIYFFQALDDLSLIHI